VFFAKWMAHPAVRHQDAFEMGMTVETDPEHVPHFALIPIGRRPDACATRQRQPVTRERNLKAQIFISVKRKEVVYHREIAGWSAIAMCPRALIDGGEVVEHLVGPVYLVFEKA
jgi:hypothetical protein